MLYRPNTELKPDPKTHTFVRRRPNPGEILSQSVLFMRPYVKYAFLQHHNMQTVLLATDRAKQNPSFSTCVGAC